MLQPIKESALGNIPTIAFCDTDSPMRYVDIGIPANNKGKLSIGCLYWLLARMVLQMRGTIIPGHKWEVMVGYRKFITTSFLLYWINYCLPIYFGSYVLPLTDYAMTRAGRPVFLQGS